MEYFLRMALKKLKWAKVQSRFRLNKTCRKCFTIYKLGKFTKKMKDDRSRNLSGTKSPQTAVLRIIQCQSHSSLKATGAVVSTKLISRLRKRFSFSRQKHAQMRDAKVDAYPP